MGRVHYYYNLLKFICYLECSLLMFRAEIAEKAFSVAWNKLLLREGAHCLVHFRYAADEHTDMSSCLSMTTVSPDRRLILCRHRQRRVLDWVVRSFKLQWFYYIKKLIYLNFLKNQLHIIKLITLKLLQHKYKYFKFWK